MIYKVVSKCFPDPPHGGKQGFRRDPHVILTWKQTTLKGYEGTASKWNKNLFVIQSENVWVGSCIYKLHDFWWNTLKMISGTCITMKYTWMFLQWCWLPETVQAEVLARWWQILPPIIRNNSIFLQLKVFKQFCTHDSLPHLNCPHSYPLHYTSMQQEYTSHCCKPSRCYDTSCYNTLAHQTHLHNHHLCHKSIPVQKSKIIMIYLSLF